MSSFERTGLAAVLAGLLLAACQPLPRPLLDVAPPSAELLALPGRGGLAVLEVEGLSGPRGRDFAAALAEALQAQEVPAIAGKGMRESMFLLGRVHARGIAGDQMEVNWEWELVDSAGATIDRRRDREVMGRREWEWAGAKALARRAAPGVATLYNARMPAGPVEEKRPQVFLAGVTGAPGDGGRTLPRALVAVMQARELEATTDRATATAIVQGVMSVTPNGAGKEKAEIKWRVSRPNGEEVGVVTQSNDVPAGSLKGAWGEIAGYVALGAGDGIADLVRRIPAPTAAPASPPAASPPPPSPPTTSHSPPAPSPILPPRPPPRR